MFTGEYQHALDNKGRVTVPSRLREALGERFLITKGLDRCIFVYPLAEWARLQQKLRKLKMTNPQSRAFKRIVFSGAMEVEADKQGRVLIPNKLREYAGIEKDVILIGVGERVEIWSENAWNDYYEEADSNYEELAEKLVDYDL